MTQYRKRPVVIDAWQIPLDSADAPRPLPVWIVDAMASGVLKLIDPAYRAMASVQTNNGRLHAIPGDWIIRGIEGELYPCSARIFAATYEPIDADRAFDQPHHGHDSEELMGSPLGQSLRRSTP